MTSFVDLKGVCLSNRIGKSSVGYRLAMFSLENHSTPLHGADYFAGHFASEEPASASVLARFGDRAVFTYSMTHVYVDPKVGNRPVDSLPERIRRNLERIRAQQ